jgi:transcriptional regulator with XRE-family HTH domain
LGQLKEGERNVTLSTLEVIAQALGVSVPELLTEKAIKHED